MADSGDPSTPISFSSFPDDVQLRILSFLSPTDLSSFASTSKHFASLRLPDSNLWYALCHRRWAPHTDITKWGDGRVGFKTLYKALSEYHNLIGFWLRVSDSTDRDPDAADSSSAALVFFEWGPSCVTGSRVSPSRDGGYSVVKTPFIWVSISSEGEVLSYVDPNCPPEKDLVAVDVNFVGKGHVLLAERRELGVRGGNSGSPEGWRVSGEEINGGENEDVVVGGAEIGSPPERLMSEMYQYFANRTSPRAGGERAVRRQRRRERERRGRRRWESEHLVKIVNSSPSPSRPLQGLWKGICEDMTLDFYFVSYDDLGGIACRRVGDSLDPGHPPVFWTSVATFIESPLSPEEEFVYSTRVHLKPVTDAANDGSEILHSRDDEVVSRLMYINSSYALVIPDLAETAANPRHVEGRIWQYTNGTFGLGFLRNNFIMDLKHIARDGQLLDVIELQGIGL